MFTHNFRRSRTGIYFLLLTLLFGSAAVSAQTEVPRPVLVFSGRQDYDSPAGKRTLYRLDVENKADFPKEIFAAAPDLPPCGKNQNSSRSWITIYGQKVGRIYAFCAITSPADLNQLAFSLPPDSVLDYVYIIISDRKTNKEYKSTLVSTQNR